ncbi:MAG: hypothetical protein FWG33_04510, partial [Oscillospiraceae bacterium]|nr:hypothetical protein [Oscillospiraceae bacterium]
KILNNVYSSIYEQKDDIINGLMEIYSSVESKDSTKEIARLEKEIAKLKSKKDLLLDLYMDKTISKPEFSERNDLLNHTIERLVGQVESLRESKANLKTLQKTLEEELSNKSSFNAELSNVLLDKIVVHKVNGDKRHLQLEIILNIGKSYLAEVGGENLPEAGKKYLCSLSEIGISQAQVSRLEKGALNKIKRKI